MTAWGTSTVGDEFFVQLGKRVDAAIARGVPKVCINNRGVRWGYIDPSVAAVELLNEADLRELRLIEGDLLVCEGGEIGRCSVWRGEVPEAYYLNTLHRLRPKQGYESELAAALLEYFVATGTLQALVGKSSLAHLTKENLLRVPLPVPPPSEQKAIATALRSADDLKVTLERLVAKKRDVKHGMMQELFAGRTRLPAFTGEWGSVRMSEIGTTYGGLVGKAKEDFGAGAASYVTFTEVMNSPRLLGTRLERVRISKGERQNGVARGDLIFNGSSETPEEVAMAAVVDFEPKGKVFLNSFCFGFRLTSGQRRVVPMYLAHWFRSRMGRDAVSVLAQGATRYNIAKTKLVDLEPVLPPPDEQQAITTALADVDAEIGALKRRLESARAAKVGMMQELLTGRTRLLVKEDA